MKKITALILIINFVLTFCAEPSFAAVKRKKMVLKTSIKKEVKRDIPQKREYIAPVFEDEFANELKKMNISNRKITKYKTAIISDEEVVMTEENKDFKRPVYTGQIKTENGVEVVLKPVNKIKTKNSSTKLKDENKKITKYKTPQPSIGSRVAFRVVKDVVKDDKVIIPKNSIVYAKVAEVSARAMGGAPAEMTIENFEIMGKDGKLTPLDGQISTSGYSLSFWIGLAELATTPLLIGLAVPLLRLLPGGEAVVTPRKNYMVYY